MLIGAASVKQLNVTDAIAVGFYHHHHNRYQSPITSGWRHRYDIEQILVQANELAQHEIVLAVQELSAPTIADALIAARRRRVTVQVILENNYSTPWIEQTPSQLKPYQRQRWYQREQLADQNGDGTTTTRRCTSTGGECWTADSSNCRSKLREPFIFRSARSSWRGST